MNTDPIADMLTRLRNATRAGHSHVRMPYSKIKLSVLEVLKKNRFIAEVKVEKSGTFDEIMVTLAEDRTHNLELKRISKPGQRIYVKASEIRTVMSGLGISILSTPQGILSNKEARKRKVGGELLCEIA